MAEHEGTRGRRCTMGRRLGALLAVVVLGAFAVPALADIGDYRCIDTGRVYLGNPRLIRRPAVVSADQVYAHIPEYQEILEKGLTDQDVRYHFLMRKASERFTKAIKAVARDGGYDFVCEVGAVVVEKDGATEPPDVTSEVTGALSA